MKMPFERVRVETAQGLAQMAMDAVSDVSVAGGLPLVCGLDSDMLPTANIHDARWLAITIYMGEGKMGLGMVKISADGVMHHIRAGSDA